LTVSSEDEEWVNCTFTDITTVLIRYKNRNAYFRNIAVDLLVQFFGITIGFFASLWGASIIAPKLSIENAYLISFIIILILFSNLWTPIKKWLDSILCNSFPKIKFYRLKQDRMHWLLQTIVGGITVASALYILSWIFTYVGTVLGDLFK